MFSSSSNLRLKKCLADWQLCFACRVIQPRQRRTPLWAHKIQTHFTNRRIHPWRLCCYCCCSFSPFLNKICCTLSCCDDGLQTRWLPNDWVSPRQFQWSIQPWISPIGGKLLSASHLALVCQLWLNLNMCLGGKWSPSSSWGTFTYVLLRLSGFFYLFVNVFEKGRKDQDTHRVSVKMFGPSLIPND